MPQTAEVTLAWDPNDPTPEGYRIFQRIEGESYDYSEPCWTGSDTQGTVYNLASDTTYYFVVRAYDGDLESADSEEVSYQTPVSETTTYTITATAGDNGGISPSGSLAVAENADQAFTITPDSGYSIADVLVDGVSQGAIASYTFSQVAADHTITVEFAVDTYWISASAGDHGDIDPVGDTEVARGGSQTFTITPDDGYSVASVVVDGVDQGLLTSYTFEGIDADHTITANFSANTYAITASAGANGSVSPAGITSVEHGGSATVTITPDSGYAVADVLVDSVSQGAIESYTFSNVADDHSLQASFTANAITVSATAGEGGTITPSGTIAVDRGDSLTFSIAADDEYEIEDLLVDGVSQGALSSYTLEAITADCSVTAVFSPVNQAPVADAGPDQKVDEGQVVTLNGLNSTDADDGIAEFHWNQIQGDEVVLSGADEGQASFTAPDVDESGVALVFELHVTDYAGETTVDTCIVNVTWVNEPPTADAGQAQTVNEGDVVTLSGTGSTDPDDGIVQYQWQQTQGPAVTLSGSASDVATFTAPDIDAEGASLAFQLTVTDAGGLQDTASCLVTVAWVNAPPEADAGENQQVSAGDEITLDGTGSKDPDGDTDLSYRWSQTEGTPVELSDATAAQPSFVAPESEEEDQTLTFQLTVTDSQGLKDLDTCQVVVTGSTTKEADTTAPVLTVTSPYSDSVTTSWFYISMAGIASDDTGVVQVAWKNNRGGSGVATGTEQWTISRLRLSYGTNVITLTATDAAGNATSVTRTVVFQSRWWWWW
ncbi:PKD domain-containing protein [uncultured Desulfosarcina sp.]|uniref:PKD domain-containing protein n=1 Tax=uncultured Desulfosarcina sp. TaxID=218289 RepID=UPI0029C8CA32|nr:PKD domain-containing protein [uncultured Desulfosarcina sp.]